MAHRLQVSEWPAEVSGMQRRLAPKMKSALLGHLTLDWFRLSAPSFSNEASGNGLQFLQLLMGCPVHTVNQELFY